MHVIKNKTQKIISICIFLVFASLVTIVRYNQTNSLGKYPSIKLNENLKQADIPWTFNLTGDPEIYIDDSNPSYNWSTNKIAYPLWITGEGTYGDPYEIKHLLFDGEDRNINIITIKNSDAVFRIEDCIFYNTNNWDGNENHGNAIYLENVENGIIKNVDTSNCTNGIRLVNSNNNEIQYVFVSNNRWGISLDNSQNNIIKYNRVFKNIHDGVYLYYSSSNTLQFNEIFENSNNHNDCGLRLIFSSSNNITDNKISLNKFRGIYVRDGSFNNILNNVMSNNSRGVECDTSHFNTIHNNTIEDDRSYGIEIKSCNNNEITENIINRTNYDGILLDNSHHSIIVGNIINTTTNLNGIYLYNSDYSNISGNVISNNGIDLRFSDESDIIGNSIEKSDKIGILLRNCYNNAIRNNLVIKCNSFGMSLIDSEIYLVSSNSLIECGYNVEGSLTLISNLEMNTSNLVNGKPLHFYYNKSGLDQNNFSNTGQIILYSCDNVDLSNMNFNNCSLGIALHYCETSTITDITSSYNNQGGVYLRECSKVQFTGNTLSQNGGSGIKFQNSINITIIDNEIKENTGSGILINNCTFSSITENTVNENYFGISLSGHNSNISENIVSFNKYGGISVGNCFDVTISGNTLNAEYESSQIGIGLSGERITVSNNVVYNNHKTLVLFEVSDSRLENNDFSTDAALQVQYIDVDSSSFVEFKNNKFKASDLAVMIIKLTYSSENSFINNKLIWGGFQLEFSDNNQFSGNYISDNGIAFSLEDSSYNAITNNTMINVMQCYRELGDCVANEFENNYCEEAGRIPIFNIIGAIIGLCGVGLVTTVMLFKRRRINRKYKESEM